MNIKNARRDMQEFATECKTFRDKFRHFVNIFAQFSNKYNAANQLLQREATDMFKAKRIEYILNLPRFSLSDEYVQRMTISDQAEYRFINEIRLWAQKYAMFSTIIGINVGSLLYITLLRYHRMIIKLPLSILAMVVTRNLLLHFSLDKIYYPVLPIFTKYRGIEKTFGDLAVQSVVSDSTQEFEATEGQK